MRTILGLRVDWIESPVVVAKMVRQGDELREYCRQDNTVVPPTQRLIGNTRNSRCYSAEYDRVVANEMEKCRIQAIEVVSL